jgi:hypothetical protein
MDGHVARSVKMTTSYEDVSREISTCKTEKEVDSKHSDEF